jgi:hypothetical protein
VARYRVLEIAAVIALLLTFAPLLRDNPVQHQSVATSGSGIPDALPARQLNPLITNLRGGLNSSSREFLLSSVSTSAASAYGSSQKTHTAVIPAHSPLGLLQSLYDWFDGNRAVEIVGQGEDVANLHVNPAKADLYQSQLSGVEDIDMQRIFAEAKVQNSEFSGVSKQLPWSVLQPLNNEVAALPQLAVATPDREVWRLGAQSGYQLWHIRTPLDEAFSQPSIARWRGGFTHGISAVRTLGQRTELGTGASVASIEYDPNLPIVLNPAEPGSAFSFDLQEKFNSINIQIGQVPLDLRYKLSQPGKRFSLVASAGIAGNFVLASTYDLEREFGARQVPAQPQSELEEVIEVERSFSQSKDFSSGIFEGGDLAGNVYLTGRLGLEADLRLNKRFSAFSALQYNQFLPLGDGIGPNRDQLSSFGISLGARINL